MFLPTINYIPFYQPLFKNCNQKTIPIFGAVVNRGETSVHQNIEASSHYHRNQRLRTNHLQLVLQPVFIGQPPYQNPRNAPKNLLATSINMMTVEQTTNWIRTFGVHRGWCEAGLYASNFSKNKIRGSMLKHLNHEVLKFDIGMFNHLHRLNLLATIRQHFPSCNNRTVISEPTRLSYLREKYKEKNHYERSADPFREERYTLRHLLPDNYETGMDLSAVQNSNKSASINSCSDIEYGDSKCSHPSRVRELLFDDKLADREESTQYSKAQRYEYLCRTRGSYKVHVKLQWR